jgi:hypothetical protein
MYHKEPIPPEKLFFIEAANQGSRWACQKNIKDAQKYLKDAQQISKRYTTNI